MPAQPTRLWPDSATILERSRGVFFAYWEELLRLRRAAKKTADPDDIHNLRVASRRFRAVLELFYPFAPKGQKTELKKIIRTLTRILGGLRNIDEAQMFFRSRLPAETPCLSSLQQMLLKCRSNELKRIKKVLGAFDQHRLDRIVREIVAGLNEETITARSSVSLLAGFSEASIRHFMPIQQLLGGSTAPEQRTSRHTLRIAIKKWRYFLEIITPILGRDYTPQLEQLKEYQSLLGQMNDIDEFEILLNSLTLAADEREDCKALLLTVDSHLLHEFTGLVERKPLAYTFLI
jgi:CHAD domain-containing protein